MSNASRTLDPHPSPGVGPVLLVSPWYRPSVGGVVECVEILRRVLTDAGIETYLLVVEEKNARFHLEPDRSVKNVWYLQIPSYLFYSPGLKSLLAMLRRAPLALWRVLRFLRGRRVRTVILNYPSGYAWLFLLLRYFLDIRLVAAYLGNDITKYKNDTPAQRWLTRRLISTSDAITVCGSHMVQIAQELVPHRSLPIHLIPNCVDVHHFMPAPLNFDRRDTRPTIVHISIFAPKKRALDIIEAFAIADVPPETKLVMVGEGRDLPAAIELARYRGIDHRIEFVGAQKDVRPYLWSADLFVLASEDEGAPLVLVEAMACGRPWISPAWGAAATLPAGECGIVVPCRSPRHLAEAMSELMNDPERRLAMGRRGRWRAETEYSGDAHLQRYLQLIEELEKSEPPST